MRWVLGGVGGTASCQWVSSLGLGRGQRRPMLSVSCRNDNIEKSESNKKYYVINSITCDV